MSAGMESRWLSIYLLVPTPGRQGGTRVLVDRLDAAIDKASAIAMIEAGTFGQGRFVGTYCANGQIVAGLAASYPPEARRTPFLRAKKVSATATPREHVQEIAPSSSARDADAARIETLRRENAAVRDQAAQAHARHQEELQRAREIIVGGQRALEQSGIDLREAREGVLDLTRQLHAARHDLSLARFEATTLRSDVAILRVDLQSARAIAADAPGIGTLLVAAGAGLAVGAVGMHLLAGPRTPQVQSDMPATPPSDTQPAAGAEISTAGPANDVSEEASSDAERLLPVSEFASRRTT